MIVFNARKWKLGKGEKRDVFNKAISWITVARKMEFLKVEAKRRVAETSMEDEKKAGGLVENMVQRVKT